MWQRPHCKPKLYTFWPFTEKVCHHLGWEANSVLEAAPGDTKMQKNKIVETFDRILGCAAAFSWVEHFQPA